MCEASIFTVSPLVARQSNFDLDNIKNINVDDLSDQQIRRVISEIESRGLSDNQFEAFARSRGASSLQISKLRQRISSLRNGISTSSSQTIVNDSRLRESASFPKNNSSENEE